MANCDFRYPEEVREELLARGLHLFQIENWEKIERGRFSKPAFDRRTTDRRVNQNRWWRGTERRVADRRALATI